MPQLLAFAATHREGSTNERLLKRAIAHAQDAGATVTLLPFSDIRLPLFDDVIPTHDTLPEGGQRFVRALQQADGLLVASPEYNWSFPAALKNVIDWVSCLRPNPFAGKTALLMSASPSRRGGLLGLTQLRTPLESMQVQVYSRYFALAEAAQHLSPEGTLDAPLDSELKEIVNGFCHFTRAHRA